MVNWRRRRKDSYQKHVADGTVFMREPVGLRVSNKVQVETHADQIIFRLAHVHPEAYVFSDKGNIKVLPKQQSLPFSSNANSCLSAAIAGKTSFSIDVGRN